VYSQAPVTALKVNTTGRDKGVSAFRVKKKEIKERSRRVWGSMVPGFGISYVTLEQCTLATEILPRSGERTAKLFHLHPALMHTTLHCPAQPPV
jgi:hypothetical protein